MKIKDWDIFKMFKGKAKEVTKETTFEEMENVNPFEQIAVLPGHVISFLEEKMYKIKNAATLRPVTSTDNFEKCHFDIICTKGT